MQRGIAHPTFQMYFFRGFTQIFFNLIIFMISYQFKNERFYRMIQLIFILFLFHFFLDNWAQRSASTPFARLGQMGVDALFQPVFISFYFYYLARLQYLSFTCDIPIVAPIRQFSNPKSVRIAPAIDF